jgi:hypothetical protein
MLAVVARNLFDGRLQASFGEVRLRVDHAVHQRLRIGVIHLGHQHQVAVRARIASFGVRFLVGMQINEVDAPFGRLSLVFFWQE